MMKSSLYGFLLMFPLAFLCVTLIGETESLRSDNAKLMTLTNESLKTCKDYKNLNLRLLAALHQLTSDNAKLMTLTNESLKTCKDYKNLNLHLLAALHQLTGDENEDDARAEFIYRKILPANAVLDASDMMRQLRGLEKQFSQANDPASLEVFKKTLAALKAQINDLKAKLEQENKRNANVGLGASLPGGIRILEYVLQQIDQYQGIIDQNKAEDH